MPPIQPSETNADEIRVLGLITFVSLLVGAAIGVFDAGLFLQVQDDVRTNAATYAMAAFTLQGMSFVLYKLLMQENAKERRAESWEDADGQWEILKAMVITRLQSAKTSPRKRSGPHRRRDATEGTHSIHTSSHDCF